MITYKKMPTGVYEVRVDGTLTGHIKKAPGGYRYTPKGQKEGGKIHPTVYAVQRSLESEEGEA